MHDQEGVAPNDTGSGASLGAHDRAAMLSVLARIFLTEMEAPALEALHESGVSDVFDDVRPGCAEALMGPWTDERLDALAAGYCGLFIMPQGVAPFAAAWLAGDPAVARASLQDEINTAMRALQVAPGDIGMGQLPVDHIGVLLALHALAVEQNAQIQQTRALLLPWSQAFAQQLVNKAREKELPLYEAAGLLLADVLDAEGAKDADQGLAS